MTVPGLIDEKIKEWNDGKLWSEEKMREAFEEVADLAYKKAKVNPK